MRNLSFLVLIFFVFGCNTGLNSKPNLVMDLVDLYTVQSTRDLAEAAGNGNIKEMEKLISNGVSVNSTGTNGMPVLFWPLREENKRGFLKLLEAGADPNLQWSTGSSITELTAGIKNPDYLRMVMLAGGNPNLINPKSAKTPIFQAIKFGYTENIKTLLKHGANINHPIDSTNITPIFYAVEIADFRTSLYLAKAGADLSVINVWGNPIGHDFNRRLDLPEKGDKDHKQFIEFLSMLSRANKEK